MSDQVGWNTADDGSCRIDAAYLVTVGRKAAAG
jgi:hypothetical protein